VPVILQSGTLQAISGNVNTISQSGTLQQITNCYLAGSGSVRIIAGTVNLAANNGTDIGNIDVASGTLYGRLQIRQAGAPGAFADVGLGTYSPIPILGTVSMVNAGTITTVSTVAAITNIAGISATLGTMGTLNYVNNLGTLYSGSLSAVTQLGSANVYAKHDLHAYDTVGTLMTTAGSLVQTASKIIKVHHYRAQTDGTASFTFNDTTPLGGTLDYGWTFNQREGIVTPFVPYPAYLFKTSTVGSALCIGTLPSGVSGTLRISVIYTDDDAA
jgi:hypothetical protein